MAAVTVNQLFTPVQLPAAVAVLYSFSIAASVLRNQRVRLTNATALPVAATLYVDVAGNASSAANACLSAYSIPASNFIDIDIPTMKTGDTLRGFAGSAAAITMHDLGGTIYS